MQDYFVKLRGYIDERRRPENFPKVCTDDLVARVNDLEGLKTITNNLLVKIIRNGGMIVITDPIKAAKEFKPDAQIFVPIHMFTHFDTETKRLASETPDLDSDVQGN